MQSSVQNVKAGNHSEMVLPAWKRYLNRIVANEVSFAAKYYDRVVQWKKLAFDTGDLLDQIDCEIKEEERSSHSAKSSNLYGSSLFLLVGNLNYSLDFQALLEELKTNLSRSDRVCLVGYNPYLKWLFLVATKLGIRKGEMPLTFVTTSDLKDIARISGFELVRIRPVGFFPFRFFGIGTFINRLFKGMPIVRWLGFAAVVYLRPVVLQESKPSLTILIPARNEKGNIENALKRLSSFKEIDIEILFVEGHSTDQTWEEINRVKEKYQSEFEIRAYQQSGKGKADAVRLGFSKATKDLLTILDADLTMPPEMLFRFYTAYCNGHGDFINGHRLVYPFEKKAMRFLNLLGNVFFAKFLSLVLETRVGDSLCGTKLFSRSSYEKFVSWRKDFGEFDPFGDFELIFPAAVMALGTVNVPIRYLDRTYGSTNISRFRHGLVLLKMTWTALVRIWWS